MDVWGSLLKHPDCQFEYQNFHHAQNLSYIGTVDNLGLKKIDRLIT